MIDALLSLTIKNLLQAHPYVADFFSIMGWERIPPTISLHDWILSLSEEYLEDSGLSRELILSHFSAFVMKMTHLQNDPGQKIHSVTIIGGHDKYGHPENIEAVLRPGKIICIVGPTGSGKSRLLADIECLAQTDTPTGRRILINGKVPEPSQRFSLEHKLVAQLSQNMNFVMDLTVTEFISLHAESRMITKVTETVKTVIECANDLAGESFTVDSSVTQLSGGQSRALMIADTALLSASPIILIDEIENAGVDRKKALELLIKEEKIVLMSTHDPILALMGELRLIIKNGGISRIIETSILERNNLHFLESMDRKLMKLRQMLRNGKEIDFNIQEYIDHEDEIIATHQENGFDTQKNHRV